jgi:hypothetical protein
MKLEITQQIMRFAESTPTGDIYQLIYPDGEVREFLFSSTMEAQVFARHFGAVMSFAEFPAEVLDTRTSYGFDEAFACVEESRRMEVRLVEEEPVKAVRKHFDLQWR